METFMFAIIILCSCKRTSPVRSIERWRKQKHDNGMTTIKYEPRAEGRQIWLALNCKTVSEITSGIKCSANHNMANEWLIINAWKSFKKNLISKVNCM